LNSELETGDVGVFVPVILCRHFKFGSLSICCGNVDYKGKYKCFKTCIKTTLKYDICTIKTHLSIVDKLMVNSCNYKVSDGKLM